MCFTVAAGFVQRHESSLTFAPDVTVTKTDDVPSVQREKETETTLSPTVLKWHHPEVDARCCHGIAVVFFFSPLHTTAPLNSYWPAGRVWRSPRWRRTSPRWPATSVVWGRTWRCEQQRVRGGLGRPGISPAGWRCKRRPSNAGPELQRQTGKNQKIYIFTVFAVFVSKFILLYYYNHTLPNIW